MTIIQVNNMNCEHCVKKIERVMLNLGLKHEINLEQKMLKVEASNLQLFDVLESLDEMGYDAEKVN